MSDSSGQTKIPIHFEMEEVEDGVKHAATYKLVVVMTQPKIKDVEHDFDYETFFKRKARQNIEDIVLKDGLVLLVDDIKTREDVNIFNYSDIIKKLNNSSSTTKREVKE